MAFEDYFGFGDWAGEVSAGKRKSKGTGGRFCSSPSESGNRRENSLEASHRPLKSVLP